MFAEELAGNASRKRAEENKARRRRLKQQQDKNKASAAPLAPFVPASSSTVSPVNTGLALPTPVATGQQLTAVERAQQQRELRGQVALQEKSASVIQSWARMVLSNSLSRKEQLSQLKQRLSDIATLRTILKVKGVEYVPPPATTTSLTRQLLAVSFTIPHFRRERYLRPLYGDLSQQLLEFCVNPSLRSTDENLNALFVWLESSEGRLRLTDLLRLFKLFAVAGGSGSFPAIAEFWRLLLVHEGNSASKSLNKHCRSMLIPPAVAHRFPPPVDTVAPLSMAYRGSSLDVMSALRYYLLYRSAGPRPIPSNAKDLRDKCISVEAQDRAGEWLLVVLDAIEAGSTDTERHLLRVRLLVDILTVPLLTWKISVPAATRLVSSTKGDMPIIAILKSLIEMHSDALAAGKVNDLLLTDDMPLTICPATASQCLLATLTKFCHMCPALNASDANELDVASATLFFNVMASLLDVIPVGTFSSRDSSVEWMTDGKGHHTPIVLSSVILDQCKLLLVDSLVRRLFTCAINTEALNTDAILTQKNDKDLKHEKDLFEEGASSAATLAAKEARIDRSRSFWNSSKWAKQLTKGVTSLLSGDNAKPSSGKKQNGGQGVLMDTSSVSRKLAGGKRASPKADEHVPAPLSAARFSPEFFYALCRMYAVVLARWGGGGQGDIIARNSTSKSGKGEVATSVPETCTLSVLNVLCFSTPIVRASWAVIQSDSIIVSDVYSVIEADRGGRAVRSLNIRPSFAKATGRKSSSTGDGAVLLYIFVCTLAHALIVTDDIEIHDMDRPLPVHQLRRCIQVLKNLLYRACCLDDIASCDANYFGLALVSASSKTMRDLYDRSSRRPMCIPKLWLVPDLLDKEIRRCKKHAEYVALLSTPVLRVCPFLVSFKRRLKLFERIITTNRIDIQGVNDANPFNSNPLRPGIPVRITRGRLLEDGLATMNHLGPNMRQRIAVQYVNEAGARESGVDAGGLFKEFWTDLSAIAFDPNYALFRVTDGAGNCLYPNPSSGAAHGSDHVVLFEFLGRILGKALYEGITIHPRFAHFFLSFLRGDYNFLHMLPDLSTIDPQLYNNLMFLKTYNGDAADLCLTFTVTSDEFGGTKEILLLPGGADMEVTNANKQRYIGLVAKYYVVDRVKEQSMAFTRGLWDVIDREWLRLFNEPELQVLISGASDGKIDVDDMRANTRYVGGFTGLDRTVNRFWNVVSKFDSKQQGELLRFVTSCERPPPLGFASMNPPFTLQRVGIIRDGDKLPSASTCFNVLKLPTYSSEKVLRERLLYAIQSGAGFELA